MIRPKLSGASKRFSRSLVMNSEIQSDVLPLIDYFSIDSNDNKIQFGIYDLIASQKIMDRKYTEVSSLNLHSNQLNTKIWLRGRLSTVRAKGNACFLVIRSKSFYTIQCCHFKSKENPDVSKQLIKYASEITQESIVDIYGTLVPADVKSCSQNSVEVQIEKLFIVSVAPVLLPFQILEASRTQEEIDASQSSDRPFPNIPQDTRLNNRWLDLRVPANHAIMRIKSAIGLLFREYLLQQGFIEIQSPKLIAGESEGGADVFRTNYFGQVYNYNIQINFFIIIKSIIND
jgi:aspartyl-tRNA synthetase